MVTALTKKERKRTTMIWFTDTNSKTSDSTLMSHFFPFSESPHFLCWNSNLLKQRKDSRKGSGRRRAISAKVESEMNSIMRKRRDIEKWKYQILETERKKWTQRKESKAKEIWCLQLPIRSNRRYHSYRVRSCVHSAPVLTQQSLEAPFVFGEFTVNRTSLSPWIWADWNVFSESRKRGKRCYIEVKSIREAIHLMFRRAISYSSRRKDKRVTFLSSVHRDVETSPSSLLDDKLVH